MDIKNPEAGGAEVFTHEIAKRLVERGHEVTLFTRNFKGAEPLEILDGVQIVRGGGKYTVYRFARQYYKKNFRGKADVVIDEINTRPFMTVKFTEEPVIAIIHQLAREYWFYETPPPINYIGYHILENRWLRNYVEVPTITVSESTRQDLLELGFNEVFVVPEGLNFTPLDEVPEKESHPVIAYVGRLTKAKRPDHAIKAFKIVNEKVPAAELWIIGDGYFRNDLEKISNGMVRFYGSLSDIGRRELVKRAWVLVNPSVREGFGLNVIEANALGTPCIAYDVAGLRDSVKDNETGFLVKAGSIENLADKIVVFLKDGLLREKLSRNALKHSRGYHWDESADAFLKAIEHVTCL
jgi:glycosyltransferase involved in cell wall biosynthesis